MTYVPIQSVTFDVRRTDRRIGISLERPICFECNSNEPMHIGMQSYAAAAHLAARVYNEQQVRCIFSFSLRSRTSCSLLRSLKGVSAGRSLWTCRCTAQQRGRVSLFHFFSFFFLFFGAERAERAVLTAGKTVRLRARKSCFYSWWSGEREREHTTGCTNPCLCCCSRSPACFSTD